MALLTDRSVKYNLNLVRANAVDRGDVIALEDETYAVVLRKEKHLFEPLEGDEESAALLAEIREAAEDNKEKVSPHFDEYVTLTLVHTVFDETGAPHPKKFERRFSEWDLVPVQA